MHFVRLCPPLFECATLAFCDMNSAAAVFRLDVPLIVLRLAKKYVMMMPAKHFSMSPGYRDWNQIFIAHLRSEKLLSFSTTQSHYHVTCLPKRADMNWKNVSNWATFFISGLRPFDTYYIFGGNWVTSSNLHFYSDQTLKMSFSSF